MRRSHELKIDPAERFRHLPGAPIVEAIIHWQARATKELRQSSFKEALQQGLREYPTIKTLRLHAFHATFQQDGSTTQTHRDDWDGLRLESPDAPYVAQFKRDGLVFSRLQPYENWERFSAEALRLWNIFIELAAPTEVERLGVRFINRVSAVTTANIAEFLRNPPKRLESPGLPIADFLYQSTHDVPGYPYRLNVIDTIQQPNTEQTGGPWLIIDIDAFTTRAFGLDDTVVENHLAHLRWLKNKAFFSLMTREAIERFDQERP